MLKNRVISSIVLIVISCLALTSGFYTGLAVTILIALGLYEFFSMLEKKGISIYKYFGIGVGVMIPLSIVFQFELTKKWELFFMVLAVVFVTLMQFKRRQNSGAVVAISTTLFGILYISWFLSFLIKIRLLDNGVNLLVLLLAIAKLGDIGAYLVGSRFGKTPLMPRISPKKSVEGAIAGLVFSCLGAVACKPFISLDYRSLLALGLVFGTLAQLGDLSESLMKRDCMVKDSGDTFPGMGGVLDVIDSLLFSAPVFYFYSTSFVR